MTESLVIAIDGPAGSGKSTLGRALASRLNLQTLDTGATYRAMAALALRRNIELTNLDAIGELARSAVLDFDHGVRIDDIDVSEEIRSDAVNAAVSVVAANALVRSVLVAWQRDWAQRHGGGIIEGRDIGSVVFPDAAVKLYLTARAEERAKRRADEGQESIDRRDRLDSTRSTSPLTMAPDAHLIDTTELSIDEVVSAVMAMIDVARGADR